MRDKMIYVAACAKLKILQSNNKSNNMNNNVDICAPTLRLNHIL